MTVPNLNTVREADDAPMADHSMPQGELGWEGHVHFPMNLPYGNGFWTPGQSFEPVSPIV